MSPPTPVETEISPAEPAAQPRRPPPMREVTKGWFTMREEAKTIEQLRAEDAVSAARRTRT